MEGTGELEEDLPSSMPAPVGGELGVVSGIGVMRGGAWNVVSRLVPSLLVIVMSVAAARYLGPDGLGRQSLIAFISLSLVLLVCGGLSSGLLRFVAEALGAGRGGQVPALSSYAWRVQWVLGAIVGLGMMAAPLAGATPALAWIFAGVGTMATSLHAVPGSVLGGAQRWRDSTVVGLVVSLVATPATVLVLVVGGGISGMFAVEAAAALAVLVVMRRRERRLLIRLRPKVALEPQRVRAFRRFALIASITVMLNLVVWRRSELLFLGAKAGDAQVAYYSIAYAAVTVLALVPQSLAMTVAPAFANLVGAEAEERLATGVRRSMRLMLLLTVPLAAMAAVMAPRAVDVFYGHRYETAAHLLQALLVLLPLTPLAGLSSALLNATRRLRLQMIVAGVAAAGDLVCAAILVPRFDAAGAVAANLVGQLLACVPLTVAAHRRVGGGIWQPGRLVANVLCSAVAAAAAAAACAALPGVVGLAGGALTFLVVFRALAQVAPLLSGDDARWVGATLGRRAQIALGAHARSALF